LKEYPMDLRSAEKVLVKPPRKGPMEREILEIKAMVERIDARSAIAVDVADELAAAVSRIEDRQIAASKRRGIWAWFQGWCA